MAKYLFTKLFAYFSVLRCAFYIVSIPFAMDRYDFIQESMVFKTFCAFYQFYALFAIFTFVNLLEGLKNVSFA